MHLSYAQEIVGFSGGSWVFNSKYPDIDSEIFYSVPTSFFVIDDRIPIVIRELIAEAEGCLKMNYLTGASACARKAIYELTVQEKAEGADYENRIKSLKGKHLNVDPELFDVLAHIQDMTSEKVHEQSWDKWNSKNLKLILEALKAVLYEIYVVPAERLLRSKAVRQLREDVRGKGKQTLPAPVNASDPVKLPGLGNLAQVDPAPKANDSPSPRE